MYELKKQLESYLRVNLLGPGPRLIYKKKKLLGRGLTKVEKHRSAPYCMQHSYICLRHSQHAKFPEQCNYSVPRCSASPKVCRSDSLSPPLQRKQALYILQPYLNDSLSPVSRNTSCMQQRTRKSYLGSDQCGGQRSRWVLILCFRAS